MIPSIGRIVIYKAIGNGEFAAMIVSVSDDKEKVALRVFSAIDTNDLHVGGVTQGDGVEQWSEPKRV